MVTSRTRTLENASNLSKWTFQRMTRPKWWNWSTETTMVICRSRNSVKFSSQRCPMISYQCHKRTATYPTYSHQRMWTIRWWISRPNLLRLLVISRGALNLTMKIVSYNHIIFCINKLLTQFIYFLQHWKRQQDSERSLTSEALSLTSSTQRVHQGTSLRRVDSQARPTISWTGRPVSQELQSIAILQALWQVPSMTKSASRKKTKQRRISGIMRVSRPNNTTSHTRWTRSRL